MMLLPNNMKDKHFLFFRQKMETDQY